jgi:peptidoglycan/LPS O-acetylase OafA/YrhL
MPLSRLNNIDILRGIAAMLVVWQHSSEIFVRFPAVGAHGSFLADISFSLDFGRIGVVCFFLISGFVIPFSFPTGDSALKKFAIRRFFRLYPVYWASIAMALLAAFTFSGTTFEPSTVLANITMLQTFFGEPHIQGLYWTLQAEVIFYCLCAGMYALGILHKNSWQFAACIVSLVFFLAVSLLKRNLPIFHGIDRELLFIPYIVAIMFSGTLLRTLLLNENTAYNRKLLMVAPLLVFGIPLAALVCSAIGIDVVAEPTRFLIGHTLGIALFIVGFYTLRLNNPFLLWLGTVSYSIYLFHPIAIKSVYWLVDQKWSSYLSSLHLSAYMLFVCLITFVIAFFTYRYFERPCIDLGRRLTGPAKNSLREPRH